MDRVSRIGFCVILIGIYWIAIADSQSQCKEVKYYDKCGVCAEDKNCPKCRNTLQNEECRHDKRCRCKENYGRKDSRCVQAPTVKYGEMCDLSKNILCSGDDFIFCLRFANGKSYCVCMLGYARDEDVGQCITREGKILDFCSLQRDTCKEIPATKCDKVEKRCLVQKGYKYNCTTDRFEKGKREHGESCNEASCSTVQPGCDPCNPDKHLECQNGNGVCDCKSGYYWDKNQGKCIAGSQKPGNSCDDNTGQCDPNEHLECKNGFCVCIDRYVLDQTKCVKMPVHDEDCSKFMCDPMDPNMECNPETTCKCKEGYEYYTALMKCVKYKEYNETCDCASCNPKCNLVCNNETFCDCKDGFQYDEHEKRCLPCHGTICNEKLPCAPRTNLECKNGVCECKEGYKYNKAKKKCTEKGLTLLAWVFIGLSILLLLLLLLFLAYWFWYRKRKNRSGEGLGGVSGEGLGEVSGQVRENEVGGAVSESENEESKKERNLWQGREQKRKPSNKIPQNYDMPNTKPEFTIISNLRRDGPHPSNKNKRKATLNLKQDSEKFKIQANKESKTKRPSTA